MHRTRQLVSQLSAAGQSNEREEVLYIANRCISALRVLRTAKRLGFRVVGGYCTSDAKESFVGALDSAVCLEGDDDGPSAYTNIPNVIKAAVAQGAKYIHPGIGFLSESGDFARACKQAGLIFVGPSPECLDLFGNKFQTCALATRLQVPNLSLGLVDRSGTLSPEQAAKLPVLLKATNGGGGIGLRLIHTKEEAADMYQRCVSEATRAFASSSSSSGDDNKNNQHAEICAEIYLSRARHVEVQLAGDGQDFVCLSDRECSVQRKFQKMIEIAPCPALDPTVREGLAACALRIAQETRYQGVGTFEFLVQDATYYFIECNPRLQVEHTVTEQIYRGLDLVAVQLRLARGLRLVPTSLQRASFGTAIQLRVCAEVYTPQGQVLPAPANTRIAAVNFPRGEFRVETFAKAGTVPNPKFDSLLAQIVVSAESFEQCCLRCVETLSELEVVGCPTNIALLKLIVQQPQFLHSQFTTSLVDRSLSTWLASLPPPSSSGGSSSDDESQPPSSFELIKGQSLLLLSPMQAHVVAISVAPGDTIVANRTVVAVLSALKMEHEIRCTRSGVVDKVITCAAGAAVDAGATLCEIILKEVQVDQLRETVVDNTKSPLFQQFYDKVKYFTQDASRPDKTGST